MMRKKCVFLLGMIFSVALCGCNANIDANAIRDFSDSVNQFAESIQSMQSDVDMVNKAISDGVENANAVMEWYTEEAFKDIPNVDTPLDEEDVRNH